MKVLVDYDNIPIVIRNRDARYLADRIYTRLLSSVPSCKSFDFRFYGGWDENRTMTKRGQELNAELGRLFPRIVGSSHLVPSVQVRVCAVLAQSLEALPRKLLQNTVRTVSFEKQLKCESPSAAACSNPDCPLDSMATFINSGICPKAGCTKTSGMVLKSKSQKLVDTMIVADLIHLAGRGEKDLGIVSSDDDMWPGIISAMQIGAHVLHVHTIPRAASPYRQHVPGNYTPLEL